MQDNFAHVENESKDMRKMKKTKTRQEKEKNRYEWCQKLVCVCTEGGTMKKERINEKGKDDELKVCIQCLQHW
jgi:hypothetical protein